MEMERQYLKNCFTLISSDENPKTVVYVPNTWPLNACQSDRSKFIETTFKKELQVVEGSIMHDGKTEIRQLVLTSHNDVPRLNKFKLTSR